MSLARERAAAVGRETQHILTAGRYITPSGTSIDLAALLAQAKAGTRSYPPEAVLPAEFREAHATTISVTNEATLVAARRQVAQGYRVAALNFASARHPGGGWLSGAWAQEESLAHASGLVACIADDPMYARHERMRDALYTSSAIYSPDVPIFRDDDGQLLNPPYLVSFITAPAVNAGIVLERDRSRRAEVMAAMRERIARVLAIAAIHGHDARADRTRTGDRGDPRPRCAHSWRVGLRRVQERPSRDRRSLRRRAAWPIPRCLRDCGLRGARHLT